MNIFFAVDPVRLVRRLVVWAFLASMADRGLRAMGVIGTFW